MPNVQTEIPGLLYSWLGTGSNAWIGSAQRPKKSIKASNLSFTSLFYLFLKLQASAKKNINQ